MERNRNKLFNPRSMVMMAVLIAMQIVLARYLGIQVNETLRISFETIPIALAGMWLGPVAGMLVALISDFLGTVISGYGVYFPAIALGPMAMGLLCGLGTKYVFRSDLSETRDSWKVIALVFAAGFVNAFVF